MDTCEYEAIREEFRPDPTLVLFIGESRPARGKFFYCGDSDLARYMCEAFDFSVEDIPSFLEHFKALGCFLVDLCSEPVNGWDDDRMRERAHIEGVPALATTLRKLSPLAIVVVKREPHFRQSVEEAVKRAAALPGPGIPHPEYLPFPMRPFWHEKYVSGLREIVRRLRRDGVLTG